MPLSIARTSSVPPVISLKRSPFFLNFFVWSGAKNTSKTYRLLEYERETHRRWRLCEAIFVESNFKWVVWWTKKTVVGKYRRESVVWSLVRTRAYLLSLGLNAPENSYKYTYTRFYSSCEFSAPESLRPSRYQQMYKEHNREAILGQCLHKKSLFITRRRKQKWTYKTRIKHTLSLSLPRPNNKEDKDTSLFLSPIWL